MALDESTTNDEVFEDGGVKFLVEKTLFEKVKPIGVDFIATPRGSDKIDCDWFDLFKKGLFDQEFNPPILEYLVVRC